MTSAATRTQGSRTKDDGVIDESPAWPRRLGAEIFGTFALVFVAVGADAMSVASGGAVSVAARAIAPALIVAAMIYAIGDVSGAHFNPVVSLAFTLRGLFPARALLPYWLAQLFGAIAAAVVVRLILGDDVRAGVTRPLAVDAAGAVAIEALLTCLLVVVILGTADRARIVGPEAAIAVGAVIALAGLIALPVEGASMNPARSLAPALVTATFGQVWIYIVGPAVGAGIAVVLTRFLHGPTPDEPKAIEAAQGSPRT